MIGNKAALVERLYLHLQDPSSSEPEPEHEDVPNATPKSEDSSEEGATTESTPVHLQPVSLCPSLDHGYKLCSEIKQHPFLTFFF